MKSLILMDTDRIKDYVFGTNKLRDIRGASAILDELNRIIMPEIVKEITKNDYEQIFSNGGVGEFIVPTGSVEPIKRKITELYEQHGASVTCSHVNLSDSFDIKKNNAEFFINKIAYDMQLLKNQSDSKIAISNSFFRTCDVCHGEAASFRDGIESDVFLCGRCQSKRNKYKAIKEDTPKYLQADSFKDDTLRWKVLDKLKNLNYPVNEETNFPDELGEIGAESDNYIALIYADGNNMRRHISKLKTLKDHQNFSEKIDGAIYDALALAINEYLHPFNNIFPFDILLLGGDDLIIVCRAREALDVAIKICEEFYRKTKGYSLSVGVAFAHTNFPIRLLLKIAENLLKVAKMERSNFMRHEKKDLEKDLFTKNRIEDFKKGAINFMRISSSSSLLYEDYLGDVLENEQSDEKFVRTFRPYSPDQLVRLLKIGRELKKTNFPKSKLEYLGQALFADKFNSMLKNLFIFTRATKKQRESLRQIFHFYPELETIPPWQSLSYDEKLKRTIILDILEIYRFLGEDKNEN